VVMAAGTPTILLPWDNALLFEEQLRQHTGPTASWTAWQVPRPMSIAEAARQHGLTEAQLREINRIPPRMMLRTGATVLVPRQGRLDNDVPEHLADNGQILLAPEGGSGSGRITVKAGDTLSGIAQRHRVSVADLRRWNRLKPEQPIRVGQVLRLHGVNEALAAAPATAKRPAAAAKRPAAPSNTTRPQAAASSKTASPTATTNTRVAQTSSKIPVAR
jgi:membrane-bound lytic murein transglycosylase D